MGTLGEIKIPKETVNDDYVRIINWNFTSGDHVNKGDVVVEVETSKATIDIEAEHDGIIEQLFADGSTVKVGEVIGRITNDHTNIDKSAVKFVDITLESESCAQNITTFSDKAKVLIEKHEIDINAFTGLDFVRELDIINYLKKKQNDLSNQLDSENKRINYIHVNGESKDSSPYKKNGFWNEAIRSSNDRGKSIIWVLLNYIFRNWLLNGLVRWAPYGIIIYIHRLRGVKVGKECFIDPSAIVETAHPGNITIGNDVRIAAHVVIMTHIKAPNHLREKGFVPLVIKPVVLNDHCFIGVNSVIMPGVTVGKGAVIASGSVVTNNVPSYCMVSGNPAKVIKEFY